MTPAAPAMAPLQLMHQASLQPTRLQQILRAVQQRKLLSTWPVATRRWSTWRMTLKTSPPSHHRCLHVAGMLCTFYVLVITTAGSLLEKHDLGCLADWQQSWTARGISKRTAM
jgi:hypothetical protein